jgi:hypothetical protein
MMVKPNNNKIAEKGYCSIDEAHSNETGEKNLYDFSYYINKGLIDADKLQYLLYNMGEYLDDEHEARIDMISGFDWYMLQFIEYGEDAG